MEDEKIIDLFFQRSEQAIQELDKKYGRILHALSNRILGDPCDAQECVNDAWLGAWNTIPPARPDPLLPYLCKIVRNISLHAYEHKTAAKRSSPYTVAMQEIDACLACSDTTESIIEAKELAHIIESFLETLSQTDRVIFMRRYAYADTYADIARHMTISEKLVSVRLTRIRQKMKRYLKEKEVLL